MPLETFKASDSLTLGVELELQLVNSYDYDLSSSANDLLELLGYDGQYLNVDTIKLQPV